MRTAIVLLILIASVFQAHAQMGPFPVEDARYTGWAASYELRGTSVLVTCLPDMHTCVIIFSPQPIATGGHLANVYGKDQQLLGTFQFQDGTTDTPGTNGARQIVLNGARQL